MVVSFLKKMSPCDDLMVYLKKSNPPKGNTKKKQENHSIPSLGYVRPTQWGPSAAAMQARGPSSADRAS